MGFLEVASITVPDAAGETYVVISMQPLSDTRNGRATVCRHFPTCGLTVKLSGRPGAPDQAPRAHTVSRARGADTQVVHGPLQRLLDGVAAQPFLTDCNDLTDVVLSHCLHETICVIWPFPEVYFPDIVSATNLKRVYLPKSNRKVDKSGTIGLHAT